MRGGIPQPFPGALFVDTSAFFAAGNRNDGNHAMAARILDTATRQRTRLITTTYVVAETHALFLSRAGYYAATNYLRRLERSAIHVIRPTLDDELGARGIIYRYSDKTFSLTDAISFAVMERLRLRDAFTFDRDFEQYGFAALG